MLTILGGSLAPIFIGLLLGYFAGRTGLVDNKDVRSLITFLITFTLPCSMFAAIAVTSRESLERQGKSSIALAVGYFAIYFAVYWASKKFAGDNAPDSAALALTVAFPNAAAVGLPLLRAVYGRHSAVSVAVALAIGAITITPITLAILDGGSEKGETSSHGTRILVSLSRALAKPVFWAPLLGIVVAMVGISLPASVDGALTIFGNATDATALFVTGLIASGQTFRMNTGVGWAVIGKNILQPALCLGVAMLLRTPSEETRHAALLSAAPCGFFGVLFEEGAGAVTDRTSSSLIGSTLFSVITLTAWIALLGRLA